MKELNTIRIRIFRKCSRCGQEEKPEIIERIIEPAITYDDETSRFTVEAFYTTDNDPYAADEEAEAKIIEKKK